MFCNIVIQIFQSILLIILVLIVSKLYLNNRSILLLLLKFQKELQKDTEEIKRRVTKIQEKTI